MLLSVKEKGQKYLDEGLSTYLIIDRFVGALVPQPSINGGSASGGTTRSIGGSRWRWSGFMFRWCFSGDGSYPRSIVAGLYAGGGGFLRSTVAALVSGKRRLIQLCLHRLLVTESGGLQSSALPSWNPRSFGLW
ncbi:hypothetical protein DY000_02019806 [Brassica cretica]|uniref:Uncharacterized protein n=1 Tax=Brassica cretica TaxID=69181 RepID=A0ABQ7CRT2_BRACR|nr:hypothetical protein DY000_02019806 [Brassica cretica]